MMMNEGSIRDALQALVEKIQAGNPGVNDDCEFLVEDFTRLLIPVPDPSKRGSRSPSPMTYAADQFGGSRVRKTFSCLRRLQRLLATGNRDQSLHTAHEALTAWNEL
jgi:hypothetical protein